MGNIDLFDRYITGQMTAEEADNFRESLNRDKETAGDFKIYLTAVHGFCKEEEQDNMDFAAAMKGITPVRLREIIGKRQVGKAAFHVSRQTVMWAASMAAMVIVAFTLTFNIQKQANIKTDNLIVEYNAIQTINRGGEDTIDITAMSEKQVGETLPLLLDEYQQMPTDSIQDKQNIGINLAMAYLKIHDRDKAIRTLDNLKNLYPEDAELAAQCNKIIKQIEQ